MHDPSNFATNLKNIRVASGLSLTEFSQELGIPKSTLQSVLADGHTSLDTAIRIANGLSLPLDTLTNGTLSPQTLNLLTGIFKTFDWFHNLSREKQQTAVFHVSAIIHLIEESDHE